VEKNISDAINKQWKKMHTETKNCIMSERVQRAIADYWREDVHKSWIRKLISEVLEKDGKLNLSVWSHTHRSCSKAESYEQLYCGCVNFWIIVSFCPFCTFAPVKNASCWWHKGFTTSLQSSDNGSIWCSKVFNFPSWLSNLYIL
jgi:hypothetical protein